MFSGSFMVIAVLVVFASHDVSGQVNTTIATTIPVSTSTPSPSPTPSSSLSQSATLRATSTTPTLSNTNFISQTSTPTPPTATPTSPTATPTPPTATPTSPTATPTPPTATPTSPTATPTSSQSSVTMNPPTTPPSSQNWTCLNLSMVIKQPWNSSYTGKSSQEFQSRITSEIKFLFNHTSKYGKLELLGQLDLKEKDGNINVTMKLCIEVKKDDTDSSVIDVLIKLNKTGELDKWKVKEGSVTFKEIGVVLGGWEVGDGECRVCGSKGGAGPLVFKRSCKSTPQSCNGLKTKKSEGCVKYCYSCAASAISSFTLIMGIILSFSFNIWK